MQIDEGAGGKMRSRPENRTSSSEERARYQRIEGGGEERRASGGTTTTHPSGGPHVSGGAVHSAGTTMCVARRAVNASTRPWATHAARTRRRRVATKGSDGGEWRKMSGGGTTGKNGYFLRENKRNQTTAGSSSLRFSPQSGRRPPGRPQGRTRALAAPSSSPRQGRPSSWWYES